VLRALSKVRQELLGAAPVLRSSVKSEAPKMGVNFDSSQKSNGRPRMTQNISATLELARSSGNLGR
jgi:hypothetical protein